METFIVRVRVCDEYCAIVTQSDECRSTSLCRGCPCGPRRARVQGLPLRCRSLVLLPRLPPRPRSHLLLLCLLLRNRMGLRSRCLLPLEVSSGLVGAALFSFSL